MCDELWVFCFVMVFLPSPLIYYIQKKDGIIKHWAYSLALSMDWQAGIPNEYSPKNCTSRCISLIFILTGFLFQSIFCCIWLSSIAHLKYEKQINSMDNIKYNNFNLTGGIYAYEYFKVIYLIYK